MRAFRPLTHSPLLVFSIIWVGPFDTLYMVCAAQAQVNQQHGRARRSEGSIGQQLPVESLCFSGSAKYSTHRKPKSPRHVAHITLQWFTKLPRPGSGRVLVSTALPVLFVWLTTRLTDLLWRCYCWVLTSAMRTRAARRPDVYYLYSLSISCLCQIFSQTVSNFFTNARGKTA